MFFFALVFYRTETNVWKVMTVAHLVQSDFRFHDNHTETFLMSSLSITLHHEGPHSLKTDQDN